MSHRTLQGKLLILNSFWRELRTPQSAMSIPKPYNFEINPFVLRLDDPSPLVSRVHRALATCSQSLESQDFQESNAAVTALVDLLCSISQTALTDPENGIRKENALVVLNEIQGFISSPTADQMVVDAISLELPKEVAKFAGVSGECQELSKSIIECLVGKCNPRDMLSILCEALDFLNEVFKSPAFLVPLFSGISKVFVCIRRRHFEQIREAVPGILNVLKAVSAQLDDKDKISIRDSLNATVSIASSIQAVSNELAGSKKEELHSLLGLYVLQTMALITTTNMALEEATRTYFMLQLSQFLPFCGLSYLGLITGSDVERITRIGLGDDCSLSRSFSFIKHGASVAVIWGHISNEVAKTTEEDMEALKDRLRSNQTKRWQAVGILKYIITSVDHPLDLKGHGIDLLLSFMEGNISRNSDTDCSSYMPSVFVALQGLQGVMIYASHTVLRKKAFTALKRVLTDIPGCQRFDILKALIMNSDSPSMIAILMDLVKEEILVETSQNVSSKNYEFTEAEKNIYPTSFWSSTVLGLVELILKPPKGGPPSLPEQSEAVVSALNLYRFLLIFESSGKTNKTGVLSNTNLLKAYSEWLLPLRTLVSAIEAENDNDSSEVASYTICAINPVILVLYRCIELVEENLKQFR